jgi:hypothetical protein
VNAERCGSTHNLVIVDAVAQEGDNMETGVGVAESQHIGCILLYRFQQRIAAPHVDGSHPAQVPRELTVAKEIVDNKLGESR